MSQGYRKEERGKASHRRGAAACADSELAAEDQQSDDFAAQPLKKARSGLPSIPWIPLRETKHE
jgi:hypothetical protein